jgi:Sec-independent protein translocase protein TatA
LDLFEIALILAIALIVIGPERLPEVLRTVGKLLRELRLASNTVLHELTDAMEDPPARPTAKLPPPAPTVRQPETSSTQSPTTQSEKT